MNSDWSARMSAAGLPIKLRIYGVYYVPRYSIQSAREILLVLSILPTQSYEPHFGFVMVLQTPDMLHFVT